MRLIACFGLAVAVCGCGAQGAPVHGRDGGTRETMQTVMILPVAGASFSATVVTEWTRIMPDGSTETMKNKRLVARDSSGRVFQERRVFAPDGDVRATAVAEMDFQDPTRKERYKCRPAAKVCMVTALDRPTEVATARAAVMPKERGTVTVEKLGEKTLEGVEVTGSREIVTLKAAVTGGTKDEPTVKEFWYSPRLQVNVVTKRFDPHVSGVQDIELKNVSLNEPDAKMFLVPDGYRLVRMDGK